MLKFVDYCSGLESTKEAVLKNVCWNAYYCRLFFATGCWLCDIFVGLGVTCWPKWESFFKCYEIADFICNTQRKLSIKDSKDSLKKWYISFFIEVYIYHFIFHWSLYPNIGALICLCLDKILNKLYALKELIWRYFGVIGTLFFLSLFLKI